MSKEFNVNQFCLDDYLDFVEGGNKKDKKKHKESQEGSKSVKGKVRLSEEGNTYRMSIGYLSSILRDSKDAPLRAVNEIPKKKERMDEAFKILGDLEIEGVDLEEGFKNLEEAATQFKGAVDEGYRITKSVYDHIYSNFVLEDYDPEEEEDDFKDSKKDKKKDKKKQKDKDKDGKKKSKKHVNRYDEDDDDNDFTLLADLY